MAYWKCEAEGGEVIQEAENEEEAFIKLCEQFGPLPREIVTIYKIDSIKIMGD